MYLIYFMPAIILVAIVLGYMFLVDITDRLRKHTFLTKEGAFLTAMFFLFILSGIVFSIAEYLSQ